MARDTLHKLRSDMEDHNEHTDAQLAEFRLRLDIVEADVRFLRSLLPKLNDDGQ